MRQHCSWTGENEASKDKRRCDEPNHKSTIALFLILFAGVEIRWIHAGIKIRPCRGLFVLGLKPRAKNRPGDLERKFITQREKSTD